MKKVLVSITLLLVVSSCTNLQTIGGGAVGLSRTDELLLAGYTWEQIEQAKANGQFHQLVKQARASGAIQRADPQRVAKIQQESMQRKAKQEEGKATQEEERRRKIAQAQQAQYDNYINNKKAICKSYGYSDSSSIASCVEREINTDRARLNAQAAEQNRINQQNFQRQQQGLNDLADIFGKMGEGTYGRPSTKSYMLQKETVSGMSKVCVYGIGTDVKTKVISSVGICPLSIQE